MDQTEMTTKDGSLLPNLLLAWDAVYLFSVTCVNYSVISYIEDKVMILIILKIGGGDIMVFIDIEDDHPLVSIIKLAITVIPVVALITYYYIKLLN